MAGTLTVWSSTVVTVHPDQGGLCLGEPKVHRHVAVQVYGGAQGGVRLLALAGRGIQHAKAPVVVGHERAHAQLIGQREGLSVVGGGPLAWRRMTLGRDLTKESQGVGGVAPFLMRTGELQRALRLGSRLVKPASAQIGFAQPDIKGRVRAMHLGPEEVFSIGSTPWNSCPPSIIFVQ
jgi:hypothetical protein